MSFFADRTASAGDSLPTDGRSIATLACTAIVISQLANFVFTPALPAIAQEFRIAAGASQLLMTAFLAGYAAVQIFAGPFADHWGRRSAFLIGLCLLSAGAVASALAPSMPLLYVAVTIQAMGAGILPTVGRAMLLDRLGADRMVQIFAILGAGLALLAAATPIIGGAMTMAAGWRVVFAAVAGASIILLMFSLRMSETLRRTGNAPEFPNLWAVYSKAVRQSGIISYSIMLGFASGAMTVFFTGAPFVFVTQLGMTIHQYGYWVLLAFLPFIAGSLLVGWMIKTQWLTMAAIARLGCIIAVVGTGLGLLFSNYDPSLTAIMVSVSIFTFGIGLAIGVGKGAALAGIKDNVAASSALITFIMIVLAAILSALAGIIETVEHWSIFSVMFVSCCFALAASFADISAQNPRGAA